MRSIFARIASALLLIAAIVAAPAPAHAAVGTAIDTCVARAMPGMMPRALFASPARFDCSTEQVDFGAGDFWVLSSPLPAIRGPVAGVRMASLWQDRVDLYILYADGAIRHTGFTSGTAHRHMLLGATLSLRLPARAASPVRLLWHVRGALNVRGIVKRASLADHRASADNELLMAALYAAFGGLGFALLVYNLALWAALRQSFQPAYCAVVLGLMAYAFTSSGAIAMMVPIDNNVRLRLNYGLLAASSGAALLFARTFFERRIFDGWLRPASTIGMCVPLAAVLLFVVAPKPWTPLLDRAISWSYFVLLGLLVPVLWRAWRLRSAYLLSFVLAWAAPIVLALVRLAAAMNVIDWNLWIDNSTLLSMAMEATLSAVAIAYRIRRLSVERDEAREQEIAALLLADIDPLTGLLNRRAFLRQAIGRAPDQALLLIDIDHFKRVNETIGHDGGDEVLRVVSRSLRGAVPADALVARLGGEEFAILVPAGLGLSPAIVLERLRTARMPYDLVVTASIGTCAGPLASEPDWKRLYRCADRALFDAKAAGRDRVRAAEPLAHAA